MTKNQKILTRIVVVCVLYAVAIVLSVVTPLHQHVEIFLFAVIFLAIGYDVIWKACKNTLRGNLFDENFLMTVATIGAFFIGEYVDAVAVTLLYQIGECFQRYAVGKSRKNIASLLDIRPESAVVLRDGIETEVHPSEITVGEIFVVKAGDKIPLDGVITEGQCNVDTRAITGESLPKNVKAGDKVVSGCIALDGVLKIKATCDYDNSTVAKILDMVENASSQKARTEKFITKFSKYYTPVVVVLAMVIGIFPPIFDGLWSVWLKRAMMFLFVSCPCALVISVPMGFFGGIAAESKMGVLVKGSNYLEILAKADLFAFDKTGTLTKGNFVVTEVVSVDDTLDLGSLVATCEQYSNHPIAVAICNAFSPCGQATVTEIFGKGIVAQMGDDQILCGNEKLFAHYGVQTPTAVGCTTVLVARNGEYLGYVAIADQIKETSKRAVCQLKNLHCKSVMLTGDNHEAAKAVAESLQIEQYHASLLPQDKVSIVEKLKEENVVAFVGDGINDAPVLTMADVGIAMGELGSDVAIEAADIVLTKDDPMTLVTAKKIAKRTVNIVKQNIIFSLVVKFAVLIVSAIGLLDKVAFGLIIAILADVGVCVVAILNSMRAMLVKKPNTKAFEE